MKRNPFTGRTHGIGPGSAELAEVRLRALAKVALQAKQNATASEQKPSKSKRSFYTNASFR